MHDANNTEYSLLPMLESGHDFSFYQTANKFLSKLRYLFWLSEKINDITLLDYIVQHYLYSNFILLTLYAIQDQHAFIHKLFKCAASISSYIPTNDWISL